MDFKGFEPVRIERWGGSVDWDDVTQLPNGVATICRNNRFRAESVLGRYGRKHTMTYAEESHATGMDVLNVLGANAKQIPVIFSSNGTLLKESPVGSGTLVPLAPPVTLPAGDYMIDTMAYNNMFMAFSDLLAPTLPPFLLNGNAGVVYPVAQNPTGMPWTKGVYAMIGDLVRTSDATGRWFRCKTAGVMGAVEPTWPTSDGYYSQNQDGSNNVVYVPCTIQDPNGTSVWSEWTPGFPTFLPPPESPEGVISVKGAPTVVGTIAAGRDVYIRFSYVNAAGESLWSGQALFLNTAANDALGVRFQQLGDSPPVPVVPFAYNGNVAVPHWAVGYGGPRMPQWLAAAIGEANPNINWPANHVFLRVYVADVAHGAGAPATFGLYATVNVDNPVLITAVPGAQATSPPTVPTANLANQPFVGEPGTRYAIVVRYDAQESPSPVDPGSPIAVQFEGGIIGNIISAVCSGAGTGNYQFQVDDVGAFQAAQNIQVLGVTDATFDGSYPVTSVAVGNAPGGTVYATGANVAARTSAGGSMAIGSKFGPVAVLPPGGPGYTEVAAALTVASDSMAGPFFEIESDEPANVISTALSLLDGNAATSCALFTLVSGVGIAPGMFAMCSGFAIEGIPQFDGMVAVVSVYGNAVTVFYAQGGVTNTSGNSAAIFTIIQYRTTIVKPGKFSCLLQFDDNFLSNELDDTDQLTSIVPPACIDIFYSPSLKRMVYTTGTDSSHYFSQQDDPANIQSPDGILAIEQTNSAKTVCFRELPNGELISMKENGGYSVTNSDDVPQNWTPGRKWQGHGPCGPLAVGIGTDWLLIISERSGAYRYYQGELLQVGHEKQGTWDRVNWTVKRKIWVTVDEEMKVAHVGLPLDGSTDINAEVTIDYWNGWEEPIIVTMTGEVKAHRYARRWSDNDLPGGKCAIAKVVKRLLAGVDPRIADYQLLYGAWNTGHGLFVDMEVPDQHHDEAQTKTGGVYDLAAIDQKYQPFFAHGEEASLFEWGGLKGQARGNGLLNMTPVIDDPDATFTAPPPKDLSDGKTNKFARGFGEVINEMATVLFDNGATVDAWFELHRCVLMQKQNADSREEED